MKSVMQKPHGAIIVVFSLLVVAVTVLGALSLAITPEVLWRVRVAYALVCLLLGGSAAALLIWFGRLGRNPIPHLASGLFIGSTLWGALTSIAVAPTAGWVYFWAKLGQAVLATAGGVIATRAFRRHAEGATNNPG
jgi:hypothetical protein